MKLDIVNNIELQSHTRESRLALECPTQKELINYRVKRGIK